MNLKPEKYKGITIQAKRTFAWGRSFVFYILKDQNNKTIPASKDTVESDAFDTKKEAIENAKRFIDSGVKFNSTKRVDFKYSGEM